MVRAAIKNCTKCGKVFTGFIDVCSDCKKIEDEQLKIVYEFLRDNPQSTSYEIATATNVAEELVIKFIHQGSLQVTEITKEEHLQCLRCGKTITRGSYCPLCLKNMHSQTTDAMKKLTIDASTEKAQPGKDAIRSFDIIKDRNK